MKNLAMKLSPIGIIHTPYNTREGMPIQPAGAEATKATIEINEEFVPGLKDLDGFSHIILLYHFHQSEGYKLEVTPFMDTVPRGLFSTRAPKRPNPIGLSVVELLKVEGNTLYVKGADILDGTPLIDIKPFVPEFDSPKNTRTGWLDEARKTVNNRVADNRFTK